jgi:hypothetical protein
MYSLMVATEPLTSAVWVQIGLNERTTFSDGRHLSHLRATHRRREIPVRRAWGSVPLRVTHLSRLRHRCARARHAAPHPHRALPDHRDVTFTHAWGGTLGIPGDWYPSVNYEL